ncbi:bifunctional DNA-formamidopyrimidine glycosylase/DNA-(apurinic or apyrimidinic site) lyase [Alteromonas sp. a30]|uniref:bifunctional DNA-formamidopyrimidine glycosylase/DNA-(apurinic or apyrimidinic site) lyase n=1 Tax=Alteromonas sp. a30 TaxID=2730917 RepID=UPI00227EA62E|nr:bifunctional DNA-formamidopyrimidine glycosylase/DNA-(apurinic or apyrimidinic site) lyase [Alteromonas sp. a30]MCY7295762.1 bifunctional DNA-formamidopyrimidine glycosylase/DNA-(apurinic or apyrimidinic site) lyase [Alteromonas sp. a30]
MPELPEVETTKRGIEPHLTSKHVSHVIVRQPKLRWPITDNLESILDGARLNTVERRAKYLLLTFEKEGTAGALMIHLGMSGNLRVIQDDAAPQKHDHLDIVFEDETTLRYCDPRRFGCVLWLGENPLSHNLLAHLGPEPLSESFNTDYLWQRSRGKSSAVKKFVMDQKVVVGIGNIYATEALFSAGIRPDKPASKVTKAQYQKFVSAAKLILENAIHQGGTTLKDFIGGDGKPGYFAQELLTYGRAGLPCITCNTTLKDIKLNNRASVYCPKCQK